MAWTKLWEDEELNNKMISFKEYYYLREATQTSLKKIAIEKLLPDKDNMEVAVDSLHKGRYSSDKSPITAYKDKGKYIVADGHHRLLQAIIGGEAYMNVKILPSDHQISRNGTIKLNFLDGDYYGLDSSLENGWLINRL
jgi:hypothetical protein